MSKPPEDQSRVKPTAGYAELNQAILYKLSVAMEDVDSLRNHLHIKADTPDVMTVCTAAQLRSVAAVTTVDVVVSSLPLNPSRNYTLECTDIQTN